MKAYVLHDIGDIRYEEVKKPILKPDEVLIEVKAVGICGSDIPRIFENGTYSFPLIPGHEFSGCIVETGAEADSDWLGKRVGVFPLLPCRNCVPCGRQHYEMCRSYSYFGSRTDGAFAQYVAVPVGNLVELPEEVSYEAAAMLEPMAVAAHAMRSMGLGEDAGLSNAGERIGCEEKDIRVEKKIGPAEKDIRAEEETSPAVKGVKAEEEAGRATKSIGQDRKETVAVCGLGTIGLLLTMFLKEAGIDDLLVIGNKEFQKKNILDLGIPEDRYLDSRDGDIVHRILDRTGGLGVDVFFECVGKNETVSEAILATAPGGRIQLVGNPASDMNFDRNTYWKILRNQLTVRGNWNSTFLHSDEDDWHYVLNLLQEGKIHPEHYITQRFRLDELEKGLHIMKDKTEEYVKVMVTL